MNASISKTPRRAMPAAAMALLLAACGAETTTTATEPPARSRAAAVAEPGTPEYMEAVLARAVQKELDRGLASMSVAVVRGGEVVFAEAYGYANIAQKGRATPDTYYHSASTFKPVTATALLTLVDRGECSLDDPVNAHLGDAAVNDDPPGSVTIRHVLDHTSGLSDEHGRGMSPVVSVWDPHRTGLIPTEQLAAAMTTVEPAGETWRYNNTAYMLAGLLIEKISGMPYERYVVENVLRPAGIDNEHPIFPTMEMVERIAFPYINADGRRNAGSFHFDSLYAAGSAQVTPSEMAKFLWAHLNGGKAHGNRILSSELSRIAHTANKEQYGLGWWIFEDERGHTRLNHGGTWFGYITTMMGDRDAGIAVYAATNTSPTQGTYRVADAALRLARGEAVSLEDRQPVAVDLAVLERYEGLYRDPMFDLHIRIKAFDGGLTSTIEHPEHLQGSARTIAPLRSRSFSANSWAMNCIS